MALRFHKKSQTYDEYGSLPEEFSLGTEEADTGHEYEPPKENDYVNKKSKSGKRFIQRHGVMIMQTAAVCLAVVIVSAAYNMDVLAHDPFNDAYEYYHIEHEIDDEIIEEIKETQKESDKKNTDKDKKDKDKKDKNDKDDSETDGPDDAFPTLTNLEPNGEVPGYGVLDEQYIMIEHSDRVPDYIYRCVQDFFIDDDGLHLENGEVLANFYYDPNATLDDMYKFPYMERYPSMFFSDTAGLVAYKSFVPTGDDTIAKPIMVGKIVNQSIPGAYYDEATNTLTLDNYSGDYLNVNLMGNGFKLKLIGDNSLDGIVVWGFMYGGSLTITGDGTLTVENTTGNPAIKLMCEGSPSCLMIDKDVSLKLKSDVGCISIINTTLNRGIYYLAPLEAKGSNGEDLLRKLVEEDNQMIWQFRTKSGKVPSSMTIARKEDE